MEFDRMGSTMWSRWESGNTGALLIVVNREIFVNPPSYVIHVLDVQREKVTEVAASDWHRWIKDKRVTRKHY